MIDLTTIDKMEAEVRVIDLETLADFSVRAVFHVLNADSTMFMWFINMRKTGVLLACHLGDSLVELEIVKVKTLLIGRLKVLFSLREQATVQAGILMDLKDRDVETHAVFVPIRPEKVWSPLDIRADLALD
jgi:hypothetical protein